MEKYVDLRGHSFARSIWELYKQAQKKTLQKNQGFKMERHLSSPSLPMPKTETVMVLMHESYHRYLNMPYE